MCNTISYHIMAVKLAVFIAVVLASLTKVAYGLESEDANNNLSEVQENVEKVVATLREDVEKLQSGSETLEGYFTQANDVLKNLANIGPKLMKLKADAITAANQKIQERAAELSDEVSKLSENAQKIIEQKANSFLSGFNEMKERLATEFKKLEEQGLSEEKKNEIMSTIQKYVNEMDSYGKEALKNANIFASQKFKAITEGLQDAQNAAEAVMKAKLKMAEEFASAAQDSAKGFASAAQDSAKGFASAAENVVSGFRSAAGSAADKFNTAARNAGNVFATTIGDFSKRIGTGAAGAGGFLGGAGFGF